MRILKRHREAYCRRRRRRRREKVRRRAPEMLRLVLGSN